MLKSVLTPKNIILAIFSIVTIGIISYFVLISTDFKALFQESKPNKTESTTEGINPTGDLPYSIFGVVKSIDRSKKEFVMIDLTLKKEYTVKFSTKSTIFIDNVQTTPEVLDTDIFVEIYSKSRFDDSKPNSDFSYILISNKPGSATEGDTKGLEGDAPIPGK